MHVRHSQFKSDIVVRSTLLAAFGFVFIGCASQRARVPLFGDPASLAGEWSGQYIGQESGRSGPILFRLTAGQDTARGDVVMLVPRTAGEAPAIYPAGTVGWQPLPGQDARVLTIRFVQVEDGQVRGRLDPYRDPACSCLVETTFEGVQQGDVITGTFITRQLDRAHSQRGRWHITRR